MARGDRQGQAQSAAPVPVPAQSGAIFGVPAGEPPAVTALRQRAESCENEAAMQENTIARMRQEIANREGFVAENRAAAAACRDAIVRLSN